LRASGLLQRHPWAELFSFGAEAAVIRSRLETWRSR
jgi:hypothetical protein